MVRNTKAAGRFDWEQIKARLARAQAALAAAAELSAEDAKAIMDERARRLAEIPTKAAETADMLELMTFRLGGEKMAIETRFVHEVCRLENITPVPDSPSFLVGLTNLRGGFLAVMDLREFFSLREPRSKSGFQVIVVGGESLDFGMVADEVYEVVPCRMDRVLDPPDLVTGIGRDCLRGVTEDARLVLNGAALLADEHLYIEEDA